MWKLAIILFAAAFGSTIAQNVLPCRFHMTVYQEYACELTGIEVLDPAEPITITGDHLDNMGNDDVLVLQIRSSNTPFMIPQLFATFANMYECDIQESNLESILLPPSVQLIWFIVYRNNVSRVDSLSIRGQERISYLELIENGITEIAEDAFQGIETINSIVLIGNELTVIPPTLFHPLVRTSYIDLERNNIVRIDETHFAMNTNLFSLYMEYNQVNEIHPNFSAGVRNNLRYMNLIGNTCVDNSFPLQDDNGWAFMHNALQTCYNNFHGLEPELRRVILEFVGNLIISDENGNIIARI